MATTTINYTLGNDTIYIGSADVTYRGLAGNDIYYVDGTTTGTLVISDSEGTNSVRLANGLSITSSTVYSNACQLTLSNGALLQILNCDAAGTQFDIGGTLTGAGTVVDYNTFVTGTLGTTVPGPGEDPTTGGAVVIGQGSGQTYILTTAQDTIVGTSGDDTVYGTISNNVVATTFQAYDSVDTDGGTDTFNLTLDNQSYFGDGNVTNVEILNIRSTSGATNFYNGGFTGLTHIFSDKSDQKLTLNDLTDTSLTVGLKGQSVKDMDVKFSSTAVTGDDTLNIQLENAGSSNPAGAANGTDLEVMASSGTNGIETLKVNVAGSDGSKLHSITSEDGTGGDVSTLKTLQVTGDQGLIIEDALDFAGAGSAGTFDASQNTGGVNVSFVAANHDKISATGGSGDDTFAFTTGLDKNDTIDGGAGDDTLAFTIAAATVKLTDLNVSNIEKAQISSTNDGAVLNADGYTGLDTVNLLGAANGAATNFQATNLAANSTVGLLSSAGAFEVASLTYSLKDATGVNDTLTINLESTDNTTAVQLEDGDTVTVDGIETVNLVSTGSLPTGTEHDLDGGANDKGLDGDKMATLNISGNSDLDLNVATGSAVLTTVDASTMTGKLELELNAVTDISVTGGTNDDTIDMTDANIDYKDTVDGGAGDDVLTATAAGLTAITGDLNIKNVEEVNLITNGNDSTMDLAAVTGANEVRLLTGNANNTFTLTNLAAGTAVGLGADGATGLKGTLKVTQAASEGDVNQTFSLESTAADNSVDVAIQMDTVTTATFAQSDDQNTSQVDISLLKATNLVATGGLTGKVLDLTNGGADVAYKDTLSFDGTGLDSGVTADFTNATGAVTVNVDASATGVTSIKTGAKNDTFTATGVANNDVFDARTGTDTGTFTLDAGFTNGTNITNFEALTFNLTAGTSVDIGTLGGLESATMTSWTVTGGSSSSKFDTKDGAIDTVTAFTTLDASAFNGAIDVAFADGDLTSKINLDGGAGSDVVTATYTTAFAANNALDMAGVETFNVIVGGNNSSTIDFKNISGLSTVNAVSANANTGNLTFNNFNSGTAIGIGDSTTDFAQSTLTVSLASATGTADSLTFKINDTNAGTNGASIAAAGIELLNIAVSETKDEAQLVNLANVEATGTETIDMTVTGGVAGKDYTVSGLNADFATIEASAFQGDYVMTGRAGTSTMTINTGSGADTIMMQNSSDALNAGAGADTLDVNYNAVVGSAQVDLNATGDQVTVFNGLANTAVQTGFQHADFSGYTGGNGIEISANASGSSIIGSEVADQINGGAGVDTLKGGTGADNIQGGDGGDSIEGGADADTILGQAGADTLKGDAGADTITGGAGADTIIGGADVDAITYSATTDGGVAGTLSAAAADTITGFVTTGDDIRLIGDFLTGNMSGTALNAVNAIVNNAGIDMDAGGTGDDTVFLIAGAAGNTSAAADLVDIADLAAALGAITNETVGYERIMAFNVNDHDATAIYYYKCTAADGAITAPEMTLLGIAATNGDLVAGDFVFA